MRRRLVSLATIVPLAALLLLVPCVVPRAADAGPSTARRTAALVAALRKQRLGTVEFKDAKFDDVIKWLRVATGKNFVIKHAQLLKADIELDDIRFTMTLTDVKVTSFLSLILKPHNMSAVVKGNVVYLTSKADSYGKLLTRMYSISHITYTKTDFIAPEIDLKPSGFIADEYEPEVVVEDDPLADGDAVAELVKQLVLPKGWEENDKWTISATKRYLVVRAPKAVHARMAHAMSMISSMK